MTIFLNELFILIPIMNYFHEQNLWFIFEVIGDLRGFRGQMWSLGRLKINYINLSHWACHFDIKHDLFPWPKLVVHLRGHWWPQRIWRSDVIIKEAENALYQFVLLSLSFWYQTWLISMTKTCGSSSRSLVTSEDLEVRCGHKGGWKCITSVCLIEPVILIPNMTYFHDQNLWFIFEVTGDLGGFGGQMWLLGRL